ncbi:USP6NL [Mytilus edulis]|uniref:USP6NL n=1 Tax=Mytilus edulis TaxID=6550 RepID=A0A8S3RZ54_MYTED|nr:USP6NL [Mytilus edulis]
MNFPPQGREEGAQIDPWEDPTFEVYHVTDRYGFIHDSRLPTQRDAAETKAKEVESERTKKWLKMMKSWKKYYPGEKMTRRIYKGIPDSLRGEIWARLLDINKVKAEQSGVYRKMKMRARAKSPDIRQIDLDINRTYRNNIMYRQRYSVNQQALFHVLSAYSMYNTEVGYCQGMSEIAALLLMYLNEEVQVIYIVISIDRLIKKKDKLKDAFWALSQMFCQKRYACHGMFMHGFPKLLRFQEHHDNILRKFLPKLKKYMIPFTLTLRFYDVFMLEGDKMLCAAAYTILKLHKRRLVKLSMENAVAYLQSGLEKDFGYEEDAVMDQIQVSIEELNKAKMLLPPKPKVNEEATLPFGLEIEPSIEQIIKGRNPNSADEHFKRNPHKGKAGYLRKRGLSNSFTPELGRSHAESSSMQSSQLSFDDQSSYYDTAANSRLSLADYHAKLSMQSSRTSYAGDSDMGEEARYTPVNDDMSPTTANYSHNSHETTVENIAELNGQQSPSVHSDYDNMETENVNFDPQAASKSDGYIRASNKDWVDQNEDEELNSQTIFSRDAMIDEKNSNNGVYISDYSNGYLSTKSQSWHSEMSTSFSVVKQSQH